MPAKRTRLFNIPSLVPCEITKLDQMPSLVPFKKIIVDKGPLMVHKWWTNSTKSPLWCCLKDPNLTKVLSIVPLSGQNFTKCPCGSLYGQNLIRCSFLGRCKWTVYKVSSLVASKTVKIGQNALFDTLLKDKAGQKNPLWYSLKGQNLTRYHIWHLPCAQN